MASAGFCPHCGTPRLAEDEFCGSCGQRLPEVTSSSQQAPPPPAYQAPPPAYQAPPAAYPPPGAYQQPVSPQPLYQPPPMGQGSGRASVAGGVKLRPVPLIGALVILVASALPWFSPAGASSSSAFDVPFAFLTGDENAGGGFKVGLALVLLALAGGVLTFVPASGVIRRLLGVAAVVIGGAFIAQLASLMSDLGGSVTDALGFGVYVAMAGGVLLAAGK